MSQNHAPYNSEEFSRRGQEIYDRDVHPALRPEDEDKFVAIDIESGMEAASTDSAVRVLEGRNAPDLRLRRPEGTP